MNTTWLSQILMGTGCESIPGMARRGRTQSHGRPAPVHDTAFLFQLSVRPLGFRLRSIHADHPGRDPQPFGGHDRVLRQFTQAFVAVKKVTADGQVRQPPHERTQPFLRIGDGCSPISIRNNPDGESQIRCPVNGFDQDCIIQKSLAAFKIDLLYAGILCLKENCLDLFKGQRTRLPGTTPDKTVVAFIVALIGQENVQSIEFHV